MHVQKYKGFTLRNEVHYQTQMNWIDCRLSQGYNVNVIIEELELMKPLVPQELSVADRLSNIKKARQSPFPLDTFTNCAECPIKAMCPAPKARDDNMYVSQDVTVTEKNDTTQTRNYFLIRVKDIFSEKEAAALKTYGFGGEDRYLSPNELVERIKAGAFTIDPDEADEPNYCPLEAFTWNPMKKDPKGLAAYRTALNDLTVSTKDAIWAETDFSKLPGLVAAFKAATVTPVTLN